MAELVNESETPGRDAQNTYAVFCGMWAIAILFHIGSYGHFGRTLYYFALTASAVWLLARPSSVPRLLLLAVLQLNEFWVKTPFIPNHTLLMAFIHLTMIWGWLLVVLRKKRFAVQGGELLRAFAPAVRLELLALYFFVVFHKLNTGFFSDRSCAIELYLGQVKALPFLPSSELALAAATYGTVAIEAAIPLLLAVRTTRNAGILLGGLFHAFLVINPHVPAYNFSAALFALYLLFAPENLASEFGRWYAQSDLKARIGSLRGMSFSYANLSLLLLGALFGLALLDLAGRWPPASLALPSSSRGFFLLLWCLYGPAVIVLFAFLVVRGGRSLRSPPNVFRPPHPSMLLLPLLVFANGFSPYLGLKTEQSYAMFSNLLTEGGRTNHLLVPAWDQPFGYQRDLVEVVESTNPRLQRMAKRRQRIAYFELRRTLSENPQDSVAFVRDGVRVELEHASADAEISTPPSLLARKFLRFRPIDAEGQERCRH